VAEHLRGVDFCIGPPGKINERNDFLITTIPSVNEAEPLSTVPLYFPYWADGGGYTTQFVLFSGRTGQSSSGTLQLFSQSGIYPDLTLR
jgi:hypothetical protein